MIGIINSFNFGTAVQPVNYRLAWANPISLANGNFDPNSTFLETNSGSDSDKTKLYFSVLGAPQLSIGDVVYFPSASNAWDVAYDPEANLGTVVFKGVPPGNTDSNFTVYIGFRQSLNIPGVLYNGRIAQNQAFTNTYWDPFNAAGISGLPPEVIPPITLEHTFLNARCITYSDYQNGLPTNQFNINSFLLDLTFTNRTPLGNYSVEYSNGNQISMPGNPWTYTTGQIGVTFNSNVMDDVAGFESDYTDEIWRVRHVETGNIVAEATIPYCEVPIP